jgi:hypothetical protein
VRVYFAARFGKAGELQGHRTELERLGHTVTSSWIDQKPKEDEAEFPSLAQRDFDDIVRADTLIGFTEPPRCASRGARHTELGIALGLNRRIILVGEHLEHVFHWLPQIQVFETWPEYLSVLRRRADLIWQ